MGLGNRYDLGTAVTPRNLAAAASTGKRLNMTGLYSVDVVVVKAAGTVEDPVISLQSHAVPTEGTPQNLAVISEYFVKAETELENDEEWVRVEPEAATHEITATAEDEQVIVFTVRQQDVPSGRPYISVNIADPGDDAQVGAVLYIMNPQDKLASPVDAPAALR